MIAKPPAEGVSAGGGAFFYPTSMFWLVAAKALEAS